MYRNMRSRLGEWIRNAEPLLLDDHLPALAEAVERGVVSKEEIRELREANLLARGLARSARQPAELLVVGVFGHTVEVAHVERAEENARVLRRAGYAATALVGGYHIAEEAQQAADRYGVRVDLHRP